ncbi:UDP-phosphate glucose phosphotransferase [Lysinibacillus contaminans]|uniref:UDP-phosphate glucose phosphotransferase n=1 Tax=Lysinibacillus contaminans TaxID=1293441 RepID=A0ABR5K5K5_9BACI|nr:sugar transferase [Lysinibacillus contaminans]KOS71722.1 UDP-phosphate glucose phosphotransferase [Lysinibacillus contaminans]
MDKQATLIDSFYGQYGKRVFDITVALILLLITLPFMFIVLLVLLITTGRPVFFTQTRTGIHEQHFMIWKLRTMEMRTVSLDLPIMDANGIPDDYFHKTAPDARVTKVGAVLRKLSIDEIPQLINVLKGDMSIVGPRPEIPAITNAYNALQAERLEVKPGLTGLAQINGRSDISHGQKINYDLQYVEKYSLWLDIKIVAKTFYVVLARTGAY